MCLIHKWDETKIIDKNHEQHTCVKCGKVQTWFVDSIKVHSCEYCDGRNHNVRVDHNLPKYTCMHGSKFVYDNYVTGDGHYEGTVPCSIRNKDGCCPYWNVTGSD